MWLSNATLTKNGSIYKFPSSTPKYEHQAKDGQYKLFGGRKTYFPSETQIKGTKVAPLICNRIGRRDKPNSSAVLWVIPNRNITISKRRGEWSIYSAQHAHTDLSEFVQLVSRITHYHHRIAKVIKLSYFLLSLCFNKDDEEAAAWHFGGHTMAAATSIDYCAGNKRKINKLETGVVCGQQNKNPHIMQWIWLTHRAVEIAIDDAGGQFQTAATVAQKRIKPIIAMIMSVTD